MQRSLQVLTSVLSDEHLGSKAFRLQLLALLGELWRASQVLRRVAHTPAVGIRRQLPFGPRGVERESCQKRAVSCAPCRTGERGPSVARLQDAARNEPNDTACHSVSCVSGRQGFGFPEPRDCFPGAGGRAASCAGQEERYPRDFSALLQIPT